MVHHTRVNREVFYAVPETCPKVDAALEEAAEKIKEQTSALRSALFEYAERALSAEDSLKDAYDRIIELENMVDKLEEVVSYYESNSNS